MNREIHFISFNISYFLSFVLYSIQYRLERIFKSLLSAFIYILNRIPTSLELWFVQTKYIFTLSS